MKITALRIALLAFIMCLFNASQATTIIVSNNNDSGVGTLRAAIISAVDGDTITFNITGTIYLNTAIEWGKGLTIIGPGSGSLTLDGQSSTNMFQMDSGLTSVSGITFNHGMAADGACVNIPETGASDTSTFSYCIFKNSVASDAGGAISCSNGRTLMMQYCTVDSCSCSANIAGGIVIFTGAVQNSTFSNCSALFYAGALWAYEFAVTVTNCTFYRNTAPTGAAVYTEVTFGILTLTNNTFAGNTSPGGGSALYVNPGPGLFSSTIVNVENNIFDGDSSNFALVSHGIVTVTSAGGNISSDSSFAGYLTNATDKEGLNPKLNPAGAVNNGGPTATIALLCSSPAINAGTLAGAPTIDQRGYPRVGTPDAGAYQLESTSTQVSQTLTICSGDSLVVGSIVHNSTGTFHDTLSNSYGCDSIVTTVLTVTQIDTSVTLVGFLTLVANSGAGKTFQWVDCENGDAPLPGDTNQVFMPIHTGVYAVVETQNNCTSMSLCYPVTIEGIAENSISDDIRIYPNPTSNSVTVAFTQTAATGTLRLLNVFGQVIFEQSIQPGKFVSLNLSNYAAGLYFIELNAAGRVSRSRVVKE